MRKRVNCIKYLNYKLYRHDQLFYVFKKFESDYRQLTFVQRGSKQQIGGVLNMVIWMLIH